jgi:hypothetical protein
VDTGPVLGLQPMWTTFLDHLPAAQPRQTETGGRTGAEAMSDYVLDDFDDVPDEDEDDDVEDGDEEGDEEGDEDSDEEEEETWQVRGQPVSAKGQPVLDFGD